MAARLLALCTGSTLLPRNIIIFVSAYNPMKSSCYDLITGKILKELPTIGIKYLTQLFNAVLLKGYFPAQWKVA
jgi:hypothetical protein